MSSASRAALRRKARSKRAARNDLWFYAVIGVIVVAIAAVAVVTTGDDSSSTTGGTEAGQTAAVTVTGEALPPFEATEEDRAVGMTLPAMTGVDFDGDPVSIDNEGAKIVVFLAHWCPHCQAEVPVLQSWIEQGGLPSDVDLYSISTAVDESMPNYPPSAWLKREGWTSPVVLDDDASKAGLAAGVSSYPYFVFVNADGTVAMRAVGELSVDSLEGALELLER